MPSNPTPAPDVDALRWSVSEDEGGPCLALGDPHSIKSLRIGLYGACERINASLAQLAALDAEVVRLREALRLVAASYCTADEEATPCDERELHDRCECCVARAALAAPTEPAGKEANAPAHLLLAWYEQCKLDAIHGMCALELWEWIDKNRTALIARASSGKEPGNG